MTRLFNPSFHDAPPAVDYVREPLVEKKRNLAWVPMDTVVVTIVGATLITIIGAIIWPH